MGLEPPVSGFKDTSIPIFDQIFFTDIVFFSIFASQKAGEEIPNYFRNHLINN